jgi:hypothetical protein
MNESQVYACNKLDKLPAEEIVLKKVNCSKAVQCPIFCTPPGGNNKTIANITKEVFDKVRSEPLLVLSSTEDLKGKGICSGVFGLKDKMCPDGLVQKGNCSTEPACGVCCIAGYVSIIYVWYICRHMTRLMMTLSIYLTCQWLLALTAC